MSGDRQLVREAIAAYFGGTQSTSDAGIYYQGGPLATAGLGTAYPYLIKGAPDKAYTTGEQAGAGWGAVLSVRLGEQHITRKAMGGATSGWRQRRYQVTCALEVLSYEPHLETAEAGLDDLIDGLLGLVYADRTLGTTSATYPTGRLITEAGEGEDGITIAGAEWTVVSRSEARGGLLITFNADTYVQA